jgi:diguanylate cyclase (GGDEF)-like protein
VDSSGTSGAEARPVPELDGSNKWQREHHFRRLSALGLIELVGESMERVLETIVRITEEHLPATRGVGIVLWDAEAEIYRTARSTIPGQTPASVEAGLRPEGGATRWIIEHREPVVVADVAADEFGPNPVLVSHGIAAYAGVPILGAGERVIGVLYAMSADSHEWLEIDLHFLESIANRAAMAITNAELILEIRQARDRAEAVGSVAEALIRAPDLAEVLDIVIEGVVRYLHSDRVVLATFDEEEEAVVDYVTGGAIAGDASQDAYEEFMNGPTGAALREGVTVRSVKGSRDDRVGSGVAQGGSIVVTPLWYLGAAFGTLTAIRSPDRCDFNDDEVLLLEAMANQAAIAIEQARLRDSTRATLAEMQALSTVSDVLRRKNDPDELLQIVADVVAAALPAERVAVVLLDPESERITRLSHGGIGADDFGSLEFADVWEGLAGWAIRNRQPAVSHRIDDPRETDRSRARRAEGGVARELAVPLLYRGQTLGALIAINAAEAARFDASSIRLAGAMAGQVSAAVAHALLFEETERLSLTDDLTGINNRRSLFELAEHEFRSAVRYDRPLTVGMIDLDNFKSVNDSFGHTVGDEVLIGVVERCSAMIRAVDVLGRYGGEEFALVLPETNHDDARVLADRLRAHVGHAPFPTSAGPIAMTVSIGLAELTPDITDFHTLLDRADAALFLAKHLGRNRVAVG